MTDPRTGEDMWTNDDEEWARAKGVSLATLTAQLERLRGDHETLSIDRPATVEDGIESPWAGRVRELTARPLPSDRITTFIPASGAASRMFASVVRTHQAGFRTFAALEEAVAGGRSELRAALIALRGASDLAIGRDAGEEVGPLLDRWLDEEAWAAQPKGLVPLHPYATHTRTAVVEHLLEAVALTGAADTHVHFTVPSGRAEAFHAQRGEAAQHLEGVAPTISTSEQARSTDTPAVTPDGHVFRDENGEPLLRPGGHGALLQNLAELDGDLIVVKNIDNVTRDENRDAVVAWRRLLVARLLELEEETHRHLRSLRADAEPAPAIDFAVRVFGRRGQGETAAEMAWSALNRPIRVVAVVRNEGQPGGGPFWVREPDGTATPQIMESAQIRRDDPEQNALFQSATHFNPVDMALSVRDPWGTPYDLLELVDDRGWLKADKTYQGRPLKALERPGLWNGAMAGWNTVFVEVPSWTFRPVKELKDLLGEGHARPAI